MWIWMPSFRNDLMIEERRQSGSVLLMVIFIIALLSTVVMGMLEVNTSEIQLMQNHVWLTQAVVLAEAGLNDAIAELYADRTWKDGFANKSFNGGSYTVTLDNTILTSTATTSQGYTATVEADIRVDIFGPPYKVSIEAIRINE